GLLDYAETMIRAAIRAAPDGTYTAEEWMDGDGPDSSPLRVLVTVEVSGDALRVDLAGTADQSDGPVNAPVASTESAVYTALKYLLLPEDVPANEGANRPVSVIVPEGSLLNPLFPAAVGARMSAVFKVVDAMFLALAPILPGRGIAPAFSAVAAIALSSRNGGLRLIYREALGGGYGAGAGYPGASGVAVTLTNTANTPVEFTESVHPYFLVEEYALRRGSGGAGRFEGGMGVEKRYRVIDDDVLFAAYSDRHHAGATGLDGGAPGARAQFLLERDGSICELPSKIIEPVRRGDRIRVLTGGGGGYGSWKPAGRRPRARHPPPPRPREPRPAPPTPPPGRGIRMRQHLSTRQDTDLTSGVRPGHARVALPCSPSPTWPTTCTRQPALARQGPVRVCLLVVGAL